MVFPAATEVLFCLTRLTPLDRINNRPCSISLPALVHMSLARRRRSARPWAIIPGVGPMPRHGGLSPPASTIRLTEWSGLPWASGDALRASWASTGS